MKASLLFPTKSIPGDLNQSINDLHIELIVQYLIENKRKQAYVLDVLSQFETNEEIILHRQDVLKDMLAHRKETEQIFAEYIKLDAIYERYQALKYQFGLFRGEVEIPMDILNDSMNDFALLILDLLNSYIGLELIFEQFDCVSKGLSQYKEHILQKTENPNFNLLIEYFKKFIKSSPDCMIGISGDDKFSLKKVELLEALPERVSFFKKKNTSAPVLSSAQTYAFYQTIYSDARLGLYRIFDDVFQGLFDPIYQYNQEWTFFEFGLALSRYYKNTFLDLCFPTVTTKNELKITSLYDLGLSIKAMKEQDQMVTITPNDCILDEFDSGRIIVGSNNTGKTVFLRSVGIAQVLFQAGLCIPAQKASMVIKNQLITFLSSKEIHTRAGGRFEKEVQQVSQLIDALDHNSMVLMNEIFQSTSLESGLEVLYDILCFFTKKEAKWFVVTHLRAIVDAKEQFKKETNQSFSVLSTRVKDGKFYMEEQN